MTVWGKMKSLYVLFKQKSSPANISFPSDRRSSPDESHFVSLIHACKDTATLRRVYAQILRRGVLSSRVASQLVSCSSLLKSPDYSLSIFRHSKEKNLFLFNALIRGLTENARFECSVRHFILMLSLGVKPDRLTFPFVLKSNSKLGFRWLGRALHATTVKDCFDCDSFVRVSLVDMYAKTRGLKYAFQVFEESPERIKKESILLWNVLINGYCRAKDMQMATTLFGSMPERNSGTWSTLIKGFVDTGELTRAKQLSELIPEQNVVSWTTLINAFSENGDYETAISTYFDMVEKGMKPNEYTIAAVLSACSKSGALGSGMRVHGYVLDNGFKLDRAIGTALIDMYSKCGEVDCAANVFSNMRHKDILSWTAMIQGWAVHGRFQQAILCFRQMMYSGEKPDEVVFLAVLTACLNSGEVDLGINFFDSMRLDYAIEPTLKHYVLVVDLLGRAGKLDEAHELIETMPINPDLTTWATLYRACKAHNSNRRGEMVSQNLLKIDRELRGSYIFLNKTYAAEGKHQDVKKRRLTLQKIVKERCKGWSYIELDGQLNKFVAGDNSHKQAKEIRLKLEEIISLAVDRGYIRGADWSIHDIEEEEKENVTGIHSEKLALTLGLLRTAPGSVIRIVKNLRICGDCHSLMKYVSKISQRDILLRDARQFHHFKDGTCSCGKLTRDMLCDAGTGEEEVDRWRFHIKYEITTTLSNYQHQSSLDMIMIMKMLIYVIAKCILEDKKRDTWEFYVKQSYHMRTNTSCQLLNESITFDDLETNGNKMARYDLRRC